VLHQRISLTPLRKLWLAWKVQALGKTSCACLKQHCDGA
jgi:hypothetical protein